MKSKTTLQTETQNFIDDLTVFSQQTMEWCSAESEKATQQVGAVISLLLADAKRISFMSTEAVALLEGIKTKVLDGQNKSKTADFIADLRSLCSREKSINDFADPVIEALQFQDRITHMMQNKVRMLTTWASMRKEVASTHQTTEELMLVLGKRLFDCTTMAGERDVIRQFFDNLPDETPLQDTPLF